VKVLDFGLAKLLETDAVASGQTRGYSPELTHSPTITTPAITQHGVILGTAAYMSPEQAKGRPADKRSDMWAFGCVLFEMLSGKRAFEGEDISDTLANILKTDPDWSVLPREIPPPLVLLLERCLHKNRAERIADFSTVLFVLREPRLRQKPVRASSSTRVSLVLLTTTFTVGVVAGAIALRALSPPARPLPVTRFAVALGSESSFSATGRHLIALSPDGTRLVYVANGQLYMRALDQLEAVPIRGTGGGIDFGRSPFFSPDGKWVGFWQDGKLKKVLADGGKSADICEAENPFGASWGDDHTNVFGGGSRGIFRVSPDGGQPELIVRDPGGTAHGPQVLPGGRSVLFTLLREGNSWDDADIVVQSLNGGRREVVIRGGTDARYLETGHLVYVANGTLFAQPFDVGSLKVSGGPVSLVERVAQSPIQTGAAHFSLSRSGTLAYVDGSFQSAVRTSTLVWLDRQGRETPLKAPPQAYTYPRISPDGSQIAVSVRGNRSDTTNLENVFIWDITRETLARLTSGGGLHRQPVWSPKGERLAYAWSAAGNPQTWWQAADGGGAPERLDDATRQGHLPTSFAPDGTKLVVDSVSPSNGIDILTLDRERKVEPFLRQSGVAARNGEVSPDGRWLAYESTESGAIQVFVRQFANLQGGRWQVSTDGGRQPSWRRDGHELFYIGPTGAIMRVPVGTGSAWRSGTPAKLLDGPYTFTLPNVLGRVYDVSPDGERFVVLKPALEAQQPQSVPDTIVVVQNWFEELKQRVPTR
jgi:serine/threonine-protein kinase